MFTRGIASNKPLLVMDAFPGHLSTADLSKRDAMGCSCLHRAARTGVPEAVCTIVKLGHFEEEDFVVPGTGDDGNWGG